jgi:hypothetical protein
VVVVCVGVSGKRVNDPSKDTFVSDKWSVLCIYLLDQATLPAAASTLCYYSSGVFQRRRSLCIWELSIPFTYMQIQKPEWLSKSNIIVKPVTGNQTRRSGKDSASKFDSPAHTK